MNELIRLVIRVGNCENYSTVMTVLKKLQYCLDIRTVFYYLDIRRRYGKLERREEVFVSI